MKVPQPTATPLFLLVRKLRRAIRYPIASRRSGQSSSNVLRDPRARRRVLNNAKIMSSFVRLSPAVAPGPRVVSSRPVRSNRATFGKPLRGRDSPTVPGATPVRGWRDGPRTARQPRGLVRSGEGGHRFGVRQAGQEGAGKKVRKSSGKALAQLRVAVELPLAADTSVAVAAMVNGACGGGVSWARRCTGTPMRRPTPRPSPTVRLSTSPSIRRSSDSCDWLGRRSRGARRRRPGGRIIAARRIAELSGARPVVAVNVEWEHAGDGSVTFRNSRGDDADKATADEVFANSFSVVYSCLPLAIRGLMGATQEGAVFKCVRGGARGTPWRILVKDDKGGVPARSARCSEGRRRTSNPLCTTRRLRSLR